MISYYDLFGLSESIRVDVGELEKIYINLQKKYHPDNSSSSNLEKSSQINDGYKILSDDFARSYYLVNLWYRFDIMHDRTINNKEILNKYTKLMERIYSSDQSVKNDIDAISDSLKESIFELLGEKFDKIPDGIQNILIEMRYCQKCEELIKNLL